MIWASAHPPLTGRLQHFRCRTVRAERTNIHAVAYDGALLAHGPRHAAQSLFCQNGIYRRNGHGLSRIQIFGKMHQTPVWQTDHSIDGRPASVTSAPREAPLGPAPRTINRNGWSRSIGRWSRSSGARTPDAVPCQSHLGAGSSGSQVPLRPMINRATCFSVSQQYLESAAREAHDQRRACSGNWCDADS